MEETAIMSLSPSNGIDTDGGDQEDWSQWRTDGRTDFYGSTSCRSGAFCASRDSNRKMVFVTMIV